MLVIPFSELSLDVSAWLESAPRETLLVKKDGVPYATVSKMIQRISQPDEIVDAMHGILVNANISAEQVHDERLSSK